MINTIKYYIKRAIEILVLRIPLFRIPRSLDDTYIMEDNSQVYLYAESEKTLPSYQPRVMIPSNKKKTDITFSLISTVYNEKKSVSNWMDNILKQTRLPDELVIVDAHSSDETVKILETYHDRCAFPLRIIKEGKVNISRGRNLAVDAAAYEIIVVSDFGCRPREDWLEKIISPFELNPATEVVAGWYESVDSNGDQLPFSIGPGLDNLDPRKFLPSSRSFAFTRSAWKMAGGYPEWLTLTGEDTYFTLELKRYCTHWAFVPSAIVEWFGPTTWKEFWRKAYYWSVGNGESGFNAWLYRQTGKRLFFSLAGMMTGLILILIGIILKAWYLGILGLIGLGIPFIYFYKRGIPPWEVPGELGLRMAQVRGFMAGARQKAEVDQRRLGESKGLYLILAGVPIDDTGGGARCTQIALELLRQNYWVVYINRYPKWETQDAGVRIAHPNLYTYALSEFYWEDFVEEFGSLLRSRPITTLIELPHADFLPLIQKIEEEGGKIVYEMIDDWDSALGGEWYSREIEREIIRLSDGLIGTAPSLQERLEEISGREALFLPNAVNSRLFNPERYYPRPLDLPEGEWVAVYIGALWGVWFDWDLLIEIARRYPEAAVVVIGDYQGQCPDPQPNLHFLGLKPQTVLPGYLVHSDVALIPWKVSPITQATSPLKLYEYLAMYTPVVAPKLDPLEGIPGILLAEGKEEFLTFVKKAVDGEFPRSEVEDFVQENNWQARLKRLLEYRNDI